MGRGQPKSLIAGRHMPAEEAQYRGYIVHFPEKRSL